MGRVLRPPNSHLFLPLPPGCDAVLTKAVPVEVIVGVVCFAILMFIGFVPLGFPGKIKARFGVRIPEAGSYTLGRVNDFVGRLGRDGLSMYRRQLVWDVVFAAFLGLSLYFLTLQAWAPVWGRGSRLPYLIGLISLAYVAFDVAEDITLLIAVRSSNLCLPPSPPFRPLDLDFSGPVRRVPCPMCSPGPVELMEEVVEAFVEGFLGLPLPPGPQPAVLAVLPGLVDGRPVAVARVFTALKFVFVLMSVVGLVAGVVYAIRAWPP
jgi:hypothetical protein